LSNFIKYKRKNQTGTLQEGSWKQRKKRKNIVQKLDVIPYLGWYKSDTYVKIIFLR